MTLIKPGLKPVLRLFPWNRLRLLLAKWGAIHRSLVHGDTRNPVRKVIGRGDMTSIISSVVARVASRYSTISGVYVGIGSFSELRKFSTT